MFLSRLELLFSRYSSHTSTPLEEEELMKLLAKPENREQVKKLIDHFAETNEQVLEMPVGMEDTILQNIFNAEKELSIISNKKERTSGVALRIGMAAMVLLIAGAAYWLFLGKESKNEVFTSRVEQGNIMPGSDRALLTTGDGSIIQLDDVKNGMLVQQGNTRVNKQGGMLSYRVTAGEQDTKVVFNTLSTPRGGQYQLLLPDGSRAWLNAASSLRFPTVFQGSNRAVTVTGEAYFEIVKNKEKPFVVHVGDMAIEVLGTHFNVNAYADEGGIKTSLLEGAVKIINNGQSNLLKPGQQAILENKSAQPKIMNANLEEVMAWKNGLFQFEGADITSLMRQVGRWYNVEIVYAGKIPFMQFEGKISRKAQLSEVLEILELNDIKVKVEDKNIIIY